MDINSLIAPILDFFTTGIGQIIANILNVIYNLISPSNAPGAFPVEIPK